MTYRLRIVKCGANQFRLIVMIREIVANRMIIGQKKLRKCLVSRMSVKMRLWVV